MKLSFRQVFKNSHRSHGEGLGCLHFAAMTEGDLNTATANIDQHGVFARKVELFLNGQVNQATFFDPVDHLNFNSALLLNFGDKSLRVFSLTASTCGHSADLGNTVFLIGS
ncbi:hypothetical protein D3C87_1527150 [compost metagenome]